MRITLSGLRKLIHEAAVKAEAFNPRNHGGMKGFLSVITKVIRALDKGGFTFVSAENDEGAMEYSDFTIRGHHILVGDDDEEDRWNVDLRNVVGEGDLEGILVKTLGAPSRVQDLGTRRVLSWEPSDNFFVVFAGDEIEFTQFP